MIKCGEKVYTRMYLTNKTAYDCTKLMDSRKKMKYLIKYYIIFRYVELISPSSGEKQLKQRALCNTNRYYDIYYYVSFYVDQ